MSSAWVPALLALCLWPDRSGAQTFMDMAPFLGLGGQGGGQAAFLGGGASLVDLDADGAVDVLHTAPTAPPTVYWRLAGGAFIEDSLGLTPATAPGFANGHVPVDIDGDGDLDVVLLRDGTLAVMVNQGDRTFVDESAGRIPWLVRNPSSGAAGDFDADGDVDVYIGSYIVSSTFPWHRCGRNVLLENDGAGHFVDRAVDYGVGDMGCTLAAAWSDLDGDGDLDLLSIDDFGSFAGSSRVYRNDGAGGSAGFSFTDVTSAWGVNHAVYGMGVSIEDWNHDGRLDLLLSSIGRTVALENHLGVDGPVFEDVTESTGLGVTYGRAGYQITWGSVFEDFDLDGFVDAIAAGGHIPAASFIDNPPEVSNVLWRGLPSGGWQRDPPGAIMPERSGHAGRGLSRGDVDGDGRPDLVEAHANSMLNLYVNSSPRARPLTVRVMPTYTGSAVGARITARCGEVTRVRELQTGGTFGGAHQPLAFFSFPPPCDQSGVPVALRVRFPSGFTVNRVVESGAAVVVDEPEWFAVDGATVRVAVTDEGGAALGPDRVSVVGDRLDVGQASLVDGAVNVSVSAIEPGASLGVVVDGVRWPVQRRVSTPVPVVRSSPTWPVASRPVTWFFESAAPPVSVVVGGVVTPAHAAGAGWWAAEQADAGPVGSRTVTVFGATGVLIESTFVVAPFASPAASRLIADRFTSVGSATGSARLRIEACDVNLRCNATAADILVTVNGSASAIDVAIDSNLVSVTFPPGSLADGDVVAVAARGLLLGAVTYRIVPTAAALAALVDPALSRCGAAFETARADGQDLATFVFDLRGSDGQRLSAPASAVGGIGSGVAVVPGSAIVSTNFSTVVARTGLFAGVATVGLTLDGIALGVICDIRLISAETEPADPLQSELATPTGMVTVDAQGNGQARVTVTARTGRGRIAGSGHEVAFATDLGHVGPIAYRGFGLYDATLYNDGGEGTVTVTASIDNAAIVGHTVVTFLPASVPPGDDPPADSDVYGPSVDTDVVEPLDASGPVDAAAETGADDVAEQVAFADVVAVDSTLAEGEDVVNVGVDDGVLADTVDADAEGGEPVEGGTVEAGSDVTAAPLDATIADAVDLPVDSGSGELFAPDGAMSGADVGAPFGDDDAVSPAEPGSRAPDATHVETGDGSAVVSDGGCAAGPTAGRGNTLMLLACVGGWLVLRSRKTASQEARGEQQPDEPTG